MLLAQRTRCGMSPDSLCPRLVVSYPYRPAFLLSLLIAVTLSLTMLGCAGVSAGSTSSSPPTVSLFPNSASLHSGSQQQFAATVSNANDDSVNWSATQGSITSTGLYTAPSVVSTKTASVTVTTVADASVHAVVNVTIMPPNPL